MIKLRNICAAALMLAFLLAGVPASAHAVATGQQLTTQALQLKGGGKEKKRKSTANSRAKQSAKDARKAMKMKESQVMGRAKVRLFFHKTFNTKYGKPVNFRSKRQRRRWKKGH